MTDAIGRQQPRQMPLWHPNDQRLLIVVSGVPVRWERVVPPPLPGRRPRPPFVPKPVRKHQERIATQAQAMVGSYAPAFPAGPLELRAVFVYPFPKHREKARPYPPTVDLDNLVKLAMDALGWHLDLEAKGGPKMVPPGRSRTPGVAWTDDAQVVTLIARKRYGDHPRTELQIRRTF